MLEIISRIPTFLGWAAVGVIAAGCNAVLIMIIRTIIEEKLMDEDEE
jgi:hypothetical protein